MSAPSDPPPAPPPPFESAAEAKLVQAKDYKTGDFTIISADNMRFRLPSYFMFANSGVIRAMYEVGTSAPLELRMTDPDLESRGPIKWWLDAMTGVDLPGGIVFGDIALSVMFLARKYDCPQITKLVTAQLFKNLDMPTQPSGMSVLRLAAVFDEPEIIAKVMRTMTDYTGSVSKEDFNRDTTLAIPGGSMLDPASWALESWRRMPVEYIWAMTRSLKMSGTPAVQAESFLSMMSQVKEADTSKKRKLGEVAA